MSDSGYARKTNAQISDTSRAPDKGRICVFYDIMAKVQLVFVFAKTSCLCVCVGGGGGVSTVV